MGVLDQVHGAQGIRLASARRAAALVHPSHGSLRAEHHRTAGQRGLVLCVPDGETGHLVARGGNITLGYLDEPEETAAILHDGWLWTGDLASRDEDGFLYHRGRSKEILKIGGHRVSPVEIEHVLAEHPEVAEAAVVGQKHPMKGEVPAAFIVARPGCHPSAENLLRFCRGRMAPFKIPVSFTLVEALPRNEAGKLLRAVLAQDQTS